MDLVEAWIWLDRAAGRDMPAAARARREAESRMRPEQLAEARERAQATATVPQEPRS
jgi:hypothetical protein